MIPTSRTGRRLVLLLAALSLAGRAGTGQTGDSPDGELPPGVAGPEEEEEQKRKMEVLLAASDSPEPLIPRGSRLDLAVTIDNPLGPIEGDLVASARYWYRDSDTATITCRRTAEVAESAGKRFLLPLPLRPDAALDLSGLEVHFRGGDFNRSWSGVEGQVASLQARQRAVLVLHGGTHVFASREGGEEPIPGLPAPSAGVRFYYPPATRTSLPASPLALQPFDAVVLTGEGASVFSQAHLEAAVHYAAGGGTLVLVPGSSFALFQQAPLVEVLPVREGMEPSPVAVPPPLARGPPGRGEEVAGLLAQAREGTLAFYAGDRGEVITATGPQPDLGPPLVAVRGYGLGQVIYFGYDVTDPRARPSTVSLLQDWMEEGIRVPMTRAPPGQVEGLTVKIPPRREVAAFLLLYLVLLVPVNYTAWKLTGRVELAWLLVPLLAVGFAYYFYRTGYLRRGQFMAVHERGRLVMPGSPEPDIESTRFLDRGRLMFYSPEHQDIAVGLPEDRVAFGVEPMVAGDPERWEVNLSYLEAGGTLTLEGFRLFGRAATTANLWYDLYDRLPGGVVVSLDSTAEGRLAGTLTSELSPGQVLGGGETATADPLPLRLVIYRWSPLSISEGASQEARLGPPLRGREPTRTTVALPAYALAPGESVELQVDLTEIRDPQGSAEGPVAVFLEAFLEEQLLQPLVGGQARAMDSVRHDVLIRIL